MKMLEKLTFNIRTDENEHATRKNRFLSNKWTQEIRVVDSNIFYSFSRGCALPRHLRFSYRLLHEKCSFS